MTDNTHNIPPSGERTASEQLRDYLSQLATGGIQGQDTPLARAHGSSSHSEALGDGARYAWERDGEPVQMVVLRSHERLTVMWAESPVSTGLPGRSRVASMAVDGGRVCYVSDLSVIERARQNGETWYPIQGLEGWFSEVIASPAGDVAGGAIENRNEVFVGPYHDPRRERAAEEALQLLNDAGASAAVFEKLLGLLHELSQAAGIQSFAGWLRMQRQQG